MSELVLYRKYRPRDFAEVVGQEHVVGAVKNSFKQGRVAHAYLFSGPRGIGKTTVARLIAKSLNCEVAERPCNRCAFCVEFNEGRSMNLIEIDAASNRGIDEIRQLRDGVRFVPARGRYKCYVIDEAHQLTKEAFNALLKTLEEPPAHAVFILATTEFEKIPATVVSRTQHYDFRRPSAVQIAGRLGELARREGMALSEDGARLIAFAAEGSMRDAESILGQIMAVADKKVTRQEVETILGLPRREAVKQLFGSIARRDAAGALTLIQELHEGGYDLAALMKLLARYLRNALFLKKDPSLWRFVEEELLPDECECIAGHLGAFRDETLVRGLAVVTENLQQFKKTPIPQLPLELTVLELIADAGERP